MILSTTDITRIVKDNPGEKRIQAAREYSSTMRMHLYGENLDDHIETITGYEGTGGRSLRAKYAKSNKDLFARVGRPIDKVFSAKGGSIYLNLSDTEDKKARALSQRLPGGISIRKWMESVWKPHSLDDPAGVIFMEVFTPKGVALAKQKGESFVYPTYKAIHHIYDYETVGSRIEWIAFTLTAEEKEIYGIKQEERAFRIVDDAYDYIVKEAHINGNREAIILSTFTLVNAFGKVPAMLNSDLMDAETEGAVISFFDPVIELANNFLLDGSIRRIHKFMHGFPKYVEYASECHECKGTGFEAGKECESCGGTGKKATVRVNDIKLLSWPSSREEAVIMPADAAAYISPDQIFFDISSQDLADLENAMHATLWGTQSSVQTSGMKTDGIKTATEVVGEMKPEADRLAVISEMAEIRHKFILDMLIRVQVRRGYEDSSVNYGRRYLLEGPDAIWLRYSDARAKGAPKAVLDTLLNEYYEATYLTDPIGLEIAKKLIYIEPFIHLSETQLKALNPDPKDYKAKLYFSEWLAEINEAVLLTKGTSELRTMLYEFVNTKELPAPAPAVI